MTGAAGRIGSACRLAPYDTDPATQVAEGDWVVTEAGSAYLVLAARRVAERHPRPGRARWRLDCVRADPAAVPADATVHPLHWYPR